MLRRTPSFKSGCQPIVKERLDTLYSNSGNRLNTENVGVAIGAIEGVQKIANTEFYKKEKEQMQNLNYIRKNFPHLFKVSIHRRVISKKNITRLYYQAAYHHVILNAMSCLLKMQAQGR